MPRCLPGAILLVFLGVLGVGGVAAASETGVVYNKYNIHTQYASGVYNASYANYTDPGAGHTVFPPNTKLRVVDTSRKSIEFLADWQGGQAKIVFEYHEPRMGMPVTQYLELITSPTPVSLDGLSELDRKGIGTGQALLGMSKEGVLAALGYPARHKTPSLESPSWIYWTNRFKSRRVDFDSSGKVVGVSN